MHRSDLGYQSLARRVIRFENTCMAPRVRTLVYRRSPSDSTALSPLAVDLALQQPFSLVTSQMRDPND